MNVYIEYELEDGMTLLVESWQEIAGTVPASAGKDKGTIKKAEKSFAAALEGVKRSALIMREKLDGLRASEVEVSFGLKTTGELGNFAVGKVGVEANYIVKLKWNNDAD